MWKKIFTILESAGRSRAAAELERQGHRDLARKIMLGEGVS